MCNLLSNFEEIYINATLAQWKNRGLAPRSPEFKSCCQIFICFLFYHRSRKYRLNLEKISHIYENIVGPNKSRKYYIQRLFVGFLHIVGKNRLYIAPCCTRTLGRSILTPVNREMITYRDDLVSTAVTRDNLGKKPN